jgi:hypothetical protein
VVFPHNETSNSDPLFIYIPCPSLAFSRVFGSTLNPLGPTYNLQLQHTLAVGTSPLRIEAHRNRKSIGATMKLEFINFLIHITSFKRHLSYENAPTRIPANHLAKTTKKTNPNNPLKSQSPPYPRFPDCEIFFPSPPRPTFIIPCVKV